MWSLTSQRVKRISGFRNFRSPPQKDFWGTFTSRREGCEFNLMAGNVATLHAAPLPTNEASMKSRGPTVRSSSGGRGGHKCVRRILKESSNNGATAPPDEHQLAVGGLPLSEDIPSLKEVAGRMIGS